MAQKQTSSGTEFLLNHERVELQAYVAQVGGRTAAHQLGLNRATVTAAMRGKPLRPTSVMFLRLGLNVLGARQLQSLLSEFESAAKGPQS